MSKEKFGFSTLSRLLGKKNKDKNATKIQDNTSQPVIINNSKGHQQNALQNDSNNTIQHPKPISPLHTATNNAPFEQTFRITVLLPREQLYVARLGARAKLKQLLQLVCENKLLADEQFEFRDPIDSSQVFDLESTIGTVGLSEIRLCHKNEQKYNSNFNSDDIVKLKSQTSNTGRNSVTSSEQSSKNSVKATSKISPYSSTNSLNSMDSTGMHANYTSPISLPPSTGSTTTIISVAGNKPPVAPLRKKRVAPRPPSEISVPEKEVLSPTTDWKRLDHKINSNINGEQKRLSLTDAAANGVLQRKEFSSSTPNLNSNGNSNGNGNAHLTIYGEIDLHESSKSIDCNGNNQTSQKNYNYSERIRESDYEHDEKLNHNNAHNRSVSVQYRNDNDKSYYGSVQNFVTTTTSTTKYDSGSFLSLDQFHHDQLHNGTEFPKPSPRKIINIKKKSTAPPPPPRTLPPPMVIPRETIKNIQSETKFQTNNSIISESDSHQDSKANQNLHCNGKDFSNKPSSLTSDLGSYDGSQTSEISTEYEQSSRTASTLSMTSQSPSLLEEQLGNLRKSTKENKQTKPLTSNNPSNEYNSKTVLSDDITNHIDDTTLICIPAPPTFADKKIELSEKNGRIPSEIPKTEVSISNNNEYKDETDLVTEAFKDIENMPDETTEIIEDFKMEEIIEVDIRYPVKPEIKEDVVIINSDIEDGYQGNKVVATIVENPECNKRPEVVKKVEPIEKLRFDVKRMEQTKTDKTENENIINTSTKSEELNIKTVLNKTSPINNIDNLIMPDVILKAQTIPNEAEFSSPVTPPPTPAVEIPTKSKTNERLYENRITMKLSNPVSFRKNIGRSDSFHATRHYQNIELKKPIQDNESESRSLSFLSLLATQREEIRTSQNLYTEHRKLENRKSTSDLTIGELPNLQSLIVMKSILNSQNNLNKLGQYDDSNTDPISNKWEDVRKKAGDNENIKSEEIPKISSILRMKNNDNNKISEENNPNDSSESSEESNTKKWKYQGRPNINLSTWSERPKHATDVVTIKNEGDYIFGGATVKRTSSISKMPRNRMSLPAASISNIQITNNNYSPDYKRQSITDIKLRKVTEDPSILSSTLSSSQTSTNDNQTQNSEFRDFRSTLRKSENSNKLYSMNEKNLYSNSNNISNGDNQSENELENINKSFHEKSKTFGPIVVRKTTGLKESILLGQKPSTAMNRVEKPTNQLPIYSYQSTTNNDIKSIEKTKNSSISSEFIMPFKMQINETALYDNSDDMTSNNRNSMPIIRSILVKPNVNIRKSTIQSNSATVPPPPIFPKPSGNSTLTTITTNTQEDDLKEDFLAEIRKFDKINLKRV